MLNYLIFAWFSLGDRYEAPQSLKKRTSGVEIIDQKRLLIELGASFF